jgi:hypothetical protein
VPCTIQHIYQLSATPNIRTLPDEDDKSGGTQTIIPKHPPVSLEPQTPSYQDDHGIKVFSAHFRDQFAKTYPPVREQVLCRWRELLPSTTPPEHSIIVFSICLSIYQ